MYSAPLGSGRRIRQRTSPEAASGDFRRRRPRASHFLPGTGRPRLARRPAGRRPRGPQCRREIRRHVGPAAAGKREFAPDGLAAGVRPGIAPPGLQRVRREPDGIGLSPRFRRGDVGRMVAGRRRRPPNHAAAPALFPTAGRRRRRHYPGSGESQSRRLRSGLPKESHALRSPPRGAAAPLKTGPRTVRPASACTSGRARPRAGG